MTTPEKFDVAVVDGREALAVVIVRPTPDGAAAAEVHANGVSKRQLAVWLRHLADSWEATP